MAEFSSLQWILWAMAVFISNIYHLGRVGIKFKEFRFTCEETDYFYISKYQIIQHGATEVLYKNVITS